MPSRYYRDLIAWKKSFELALAIYRATQNFPEKEKYGLTAQIRRAEVSRQSPVASKKSSAQNGRWSLVGWRRSMPAKDYRDLIAWKKSFELALAIYRATQNFPEKEKYGLTAQIRRAGVSIPSNIAEGEGRHSKEFRHFLSIALGSLNEVETQILISDALGYLEKPETTTLMGMAAEVGRVINGLSRSLLNSLPK